MKKIYTNFKLLLSIQNQDEFEIDFNSTVIPDIDIDKENGFYKRLDMFIKNELFLANQILTKHYNKNIEVHNKYLKEMFLKHMYTNNLTLAVYTMSLKMNNMERYNDLYKFNKIELDILEKKINDKNLKEIILSDIEISSLHLSLTEENKQALANYLVKEIDLILDENYHRFQTKITNSEQEAMTAEFNYYLKLLQLAIKNNKSMETFWESI